MERYSIGERVGIWFVYNTCLPIVFIGLAWGIEKYVLAADHPAVDTFGTGDLLPLAAVLLFGIGAEIFANKANSGWLLTHQLIFVIVTVVLAVMYGAMKSKGIQDLRVPNDMSYQQLLDFSSVSCVMIGYSVIHSTFAKVQLELRIARSVYG